MANGERRIAAMLRRMAPPQGRQLRPCLMSSIPAGDRHTSRRHLPSIPAPVRSTIPSATLGPGSVCWGPVLCRASRSMRVSLPLRALAANFEAFIAMPFSTGRLPRNLPAFVVISCVAEGPVGPLCVFPGGRDAVELAGQARRYCPNPILHTDNPHVVRSHCCSGRRSRPAQITPFALYHYRRRRRGGHCDRRRDHLVDVRLGMRRREVARKMFEQKHTFLAKPVEQQIPVFLIFSHPDKHERLEMRHTNRNRALDKETMVSGSSAAGRPPPITLP